CDWLRADELRLFLCAGARCREPGAPHDGDKHSGAAIPRLKRGATHRAYDDRRNRTVWLCHPRPPGVHAMLPAKMYGRPVHVVMRSGFLIVAEALTLHL